MKAIFSSLILVASLQALATSNEKMSVEELKQEIKAKIQKCEVPQSYCFQHLASLNNESSCQELRDFLRNSGIVCNNIETHQETDVANIASCKEE